MIRVFTSKVLDEALTADERVALIADFKKYKAGKLPALFGKDVPYDHPFNLDIIKQEQVRHIHLAASGAGFPIFITQAKRTSDTHLVYCRGFTNENCYLLMAILQPNAHDLAKSNQLMYQLGLMAQAFRQQF
ncbi:type II toxin-antitoxin system YafO family toxin [Rheinheimera sp.]|uniref:type II toxin-antitoxin system YafO family toxin n=1 Tax=Rheinheimera sp. TaxID=1869214 RepID=UPI002733ED7A|nr:type II toxin-antitoxin system YafO family toxin [Rheinheimera sp.]MDP2714794.1 type II toxin-antitoxin system YafO family toxin [Rheinheimera sp.]